MIILSIIDWTRLRGAGQAGRVRSSTGRAKCRPLCQTAGSTDKLGDFLMLLRIKLPVVFVMQSFQLPAHRRNRSAQLMTDDCSKSSSFWLSIFSNCSTGHSKNGGERQSDR